MSKPKIVLSVNPSYHCNFRCSFCYLTPEQLGDTLTLTIARLDTLLSEVSRHYQIDHIDLYGGEVLLLPTDYHAELNRLWAKYDIPSLNLNTNLSLVNEVALNPNYTLSVSYDFTAREKHERVLENMLTLPRSYRILTLVSRTLLDTVTVDECVQTFNLLGQCDGVEFKPYSSNQANQHPVNYTEFEDFVYGVLTHPERTFEVENEHLLESVLDGTRNSFSDDHLYITPTGELAVLEFDDQSHEYFLPVGDIKGYRTWCSQEKRRVSHNVVCGKCNYFGNCLSEHLRPVVSLENSCNGFHNLIVKWSEPC